MKYQIYLLFSICLFSCNSPESENINKPIDKKKNIKGTKLSLSNPVQLDSSIFVMYPLLLTENEIEIDESYGKSSGRSYTYWNMIFYNTLTGESHLLDENRKMVIYQFDQKSTGSNSSEPIAKNNTSNFRNKLIYYTVKTLDHNNNGILDSKDPDYLFISDKEGKTLNRFRQIMVMLMNGNW